MTFVIVGAFEVFLDGKTHKVIQGDVVNFPRLVPHGFSNVCGRPGRTLFTVVPGANFEKFFEDLSALPSDQPADMAKGGEIFARYDIEILQQPKPK